jgi:hypothetical protein
MGKVAKFPKSAWGKIGKRQRAWSAARRYDSLFTREKTHCWKKRKYILKFVSLL